MDAYYECVATRSHNNWGPEGRKQNYPALPIPVLPETTPGEIILIIRMNNLVTLLQIWGPTRLHPTSSWCSCKGVCVRVTFGPLDHVSHNLLIITYDAV